MILITCNYCAPLYTSLRIFHYFLINVATPNESFQFSINNVFSCQYFKYNSLVKKSPSPTHSRLYALVPVEYYDSYYLICRLNYFNSILINTNKKSLYQYQ